MSGPVAVIGVGMMGGSLGLALRERAGVDRIRGFDPAAGAVAAALAAGAITEGSGSVATAVADAEMVFLAAPVGRLPELAREVLVAVGPRALVSDLGSAKAGVMAALSGVERERFIGGHPICGSEHAGVESARGDLFDGATYFLTPAPEARPELFARLHGLVVQLGAQPVAIDPEVHDDLMALVSHLPHVLAGALIAQAAGTAPGGREALRSAGPSFADLTRVAGANPALWADIALANRDALAAALGDYGARLTRVGEALGRGDRRWLEEFFAEAAAGRDRLRSIAPLAADPWLVVVAVPDRPGVISEIATALGHAHINIDDLTLRPGAGPAGGELHLIVSGEADAAAAEERIAARGHRVRLRARA